MPGIAHQESSAELPPRRSTNGAPGDRLPSKFTKGVSGWAAEPDRAGIVVSSVAMPRKPRAVEVAATAAAPPARTVALSEAGVTTVGPLTAVVGKLVRSVTLLSALVSLSVAETAPTNGFFAVTAATEAFGIALVCMSAGGAAAAIAAGTPTAQTAAQAAKRAIRDFLSITISVDQDYTATELCATTGYSSGTQPVTAP